MSDSKRVLRLYAHYSKTLAGLLKQGDFAEVDEWMTIENSLIAVQLALATARLTRHKTPG